MIFLGNKIESKSSIKILGVTFDSKLNWQTHVNQTILKCKKTLQAIKIISPNFNIDEKLNIVTSLLYSKLYYGSDIWLIPTLNTTCKRKLLSISTQALRIVSNDYLKIFNSNEVHLMLNRFTPAQWSIYSSLLCFYKIFNNHIPQPIWIELQFSSLARSRANKFYFPPKNNLRVGINSFSNRLNVISNLITTDNLNLSPQSFKVLIKNIIKNL